MIGTKAIPNVVIILIAIGLSVLSISNQIISLLFLIFAIIWGIGTIFRMMTDEITFQ